MAEQKPTPEKRVKATTAVTVRKEQPSEFVRVASSFVGSDVREVKNNIISDIVIPSFKKLLDDMIHGLLFPGETSRSVSKSGNQRTNYSTSRVSYAPAAQRTERKATMFSWDEFTFDTSRDAQKVLSDLDDILEAYGNVSIGDYYDELQQTPDANAYNYGWENLAQARVTPANHGRWKIDFPRPILLRRN